MLWLLIAACAAWVLLSLFDTVQLVTLPWLFEPEPCDERLPRVTLVVPARDEAEMAARCVASLRALDYPDYEVVWVDDGSTDGTPEIVERAVDGDDRFTTLASAARPEGWIGKSWAVHQGAKHASGEWLLFADADSVYEPACLKVAMTRVLNHELDFLSLLPGYLGFGTCEKLVAPAFVTFLGTFFPFWWVNRHPTRALAWGGFLLIRRSLYERLGGHEPLKHSVLEDRLMARAVKRSGGRAWVGITNSMIKTRQYPRFRDLWEGYGKQAFALVDHSPLKVLAVTLAVPVMTVVPFVGLWLGLAGGPESYLWLSGISLALMAITASAVLAIARIPQRWIVGYPIGLLFYLGILIDSMRQGLRGHTRWRGRSYRTSPSR